LNTAQTLIYSLKMHPPVPFAGVGSDPVPDILPDISLCNRLIHRHPERLVAVHCTHGVNRTGFFVATYLVEKVGMGIKEALEAFGSARGTSLFDRSV
jgi:protein-tyrosine phosphatase